ncbi:MAG: tetratricopeptide repeat protein [Anaerolineales bacterium]
MRALIPTFILDKHFSGETRGDFTSAALFVDLSGFSAMADTLSLQGQYGAEVLAEMMRVVFEPLVNAVYEQGGFVIGYAGDAFNAVFPDGQLEGQAMMRCLAAAKSMQSHIQSHRMVKNSLGEFPISLKIGLGYGETRWQIFKSINGEHATFWFRGDSLSDAVQAEEMAAPGKIMASRSAYEMLQNAVRVERVGECFEVAHVKADLPDPLPISNVQPDSAQLKVFFPEDVSHLPAIGEFRQVVNLFIDIPINISDEALVTPFMETVYLLQEKYGGFFLRPDLGDKGFNLLMFWGAPIAHENDVELALNFMLELSERTGLDLRAGITYRVGYAGFMGSSLREDYTNYGWGINLAARLMEHATPGGFWMDAEVARRAEKKFKTEYLNDFSFKGFAQKQKTYVLTGRKDLIETVYQGDLLGRENELQQLEAFVRPLMSGEFAGIVVLRGEAGIGKSRLVHAFQKSNYFQEFNAQWIVCQANEILRLSYNPFIDWLRARFGFQELKPDDVNWEIFLSRLQPLIERTADSGLAEELKRTSSFLAALLNISVPDSLYSQLDAKGRHENTQIALATLLRAESLQKPLVLFLEDTHWLDEESGAFLSFLIRSILSEPEKKYPIALIATQRLEGDSIHMMDDVAMADVKLTKLTQDNLGLLAKNILGKPVSKSLVELLNSRAEGNPFFAEQIVRFLLENNALLEENGVYSPASNARNSLPFDVQAVLIARLDRLNRMVRDTVQTASVLGREFEIRILSQMLQNDASLSTHVKAAEESNIWSPLNELEYIFRHALLRDAAYSMQLESRQRELHKLAFNSIEELYKIDLEPHYGELAYHAEHAGLKESALHYLKLAAASASIAYQNSQAVDYLSRALGFTLQSDSYAQFELLFQRSIVYYNVGNRIKEDADLNQMRDLADSLKDDRLLARVLTRRAYYFSTISENAMAISSAEQAIEIARSLKDVDILNEIYDVLPSAFMRLGKLEDAFKYAQDALEFTRSIGNRLWEGKALASIGLISLEKLGPSAAYDYQVEALSIAREVDNPALEANVLNSIANVVGLSQGDYFTSREYFEKSLQIYQSQGNLYAEGYLLTNLGWVSGILGDYEVALNYHTRSLSIAREVGNRTQEMYTLINLSAVAIGKNNPAVAITWAEKAFDLSEKIEDRTGRAWAFYYLGYGFLLNKQYARARNMFVDSLEIRKSIGIKVLLAESRAAVAQVELDMKNIDRAIVEVEEVLLYMQENPHFEGAEEPLRILLSCFLVLKEKRDPRHKDVLQHAIQLLDMQVSKLPTEDIRRTYVEMVPWRRYLKKYFEEIN